MIAEFDFSQKPDRFDLKGGEKTMMAVVTTGNGDYDKALDYLQIVIDGPRDADRRPEPLLKAVYAAQASGADDHAGELLTLLQSDYPDSEQAALAAAELSRE